MTCTPSNEWATFSIQFITVSKMIGDRKVFLSMALIRTGLIISLVASKMPLIVSNRAIALIASQGTLAVAVIKFAHVLSSK